MNMKKPYIVIILVVLFIVIGLSIHKTFENTQPMPASPPPDIPPLVISYFPESNKVQSINTTHGFYDFTDENLSEELIVVYNGRRTNTFQVSSNRYHREFQAQPYVCNNDLHLKTCIIEVNWDIIRQFENREIEKYKESSKLRDDISNRIKKTLNDVKQITYNPAKETIIIQNCEGSLDKPKCITESTKAVFGNVGEV